ncbi:hypothetical protein [Streptomyces alanosinicus]|uniref:Uncharacterized protein n=1 Tax=Streptomyces alanosinicus TaxID=68171 RepID=A0A919D4U2_9ACTN|nr:hypothetical protein [Streptomyces alanosinicus]GHE07341.1 hypothetical protein GCM10010339_52050 [Streptomyces alanosinicus]
MKAGATGKKTSKAAATGRAGAKSNRPGAKSTTGKAGKTGQAGTTGQAGKAGKTGKAGGPSRSRASGSAQGRQKDGRPQPTAHSGFMQHVKVLFAFMIWMTLLRQQASLIAVWQLYYAQALVAVFALVVATLVVIYMYPPRTARWRTIAWTFLASSLTGALAFAALGGRFGLLGALLGGALVLWARAEENGRRVVRRLRQKRRP